MSLDGVAEESVSIDFFGNHYKTGTGGQDYIVNAAAAGAGVQEHWNSATARQYSRNIDPVNGKGIELVYINATIDAKRAASIGSTSGLAISDYTHGTLHFTLPQAGEFLLRAYTLSGKRTSVSASAKGARGPNTVTLPLRRGVYLLRISLPGGGHVEKEVTILK